MTDLQRVSFSVTADDVELARAWLLERFPDGFEERAKGDRVELVVYTDGAGADEIGSTFPDARSEPVESGWEDRWKEFHRPVRAGGLWIGPPWIPPPSGETAVVVDPGRAFGTGAHPTTRACIELLSRLERGSLVDAGCGSGVLAVSAVKLGFAPVVALDSDPTAVEVARATARANHVEIDVRRLDVLAEPVPDANVLVANIELAAVEALLARIRAPVAVVSGYLDPDSPQVPGWASIDRIELEGWAADALAGAY